MGLLEPISEIMGKLDAPGAGHTGRPFSAAFLILSYTCYLYPISAESSMILELLSRALSMQINYIVNVLYLL